jgi:hypothetical protein
MVKLDGASPIRHGDITAWAADGVIHWKDERRPATVHALVEPFEHVTSIVLSPTLLEARAADGEYRNPLVIFAPDGRRLARYDGGLIVAMDVTTGKTLRAFSGALEGQTPQGVGAMAFSADGRFFAAGGTLESDAVTDARIVFVWNDDLEQTPYAIKVFADVVALSFSADSRTLAITTSSSVTLHSVRSDLWEHANEVLRRVEDESGRVVVGVDLIWRSATE